uniref:TLC domain-containing protein n=1 Tax=Knipowitschia caucasica TaxID=637954 RepID=A0AAV2K199_KNICA
MLVQLSIPAADRGHPLLLRLRAVLLPVSALLPVHRHTTEVCVMCTATGTRPRPPRSPSADFPIMLVHHMATISLISFSYVNNMARVGTLVMCLHDAADVLIEAAKMANYAKCHLLCNLLFAMFALLFISSRLGVFPIWILNTTLLESWEIVGPYPSWWLFNLLLLLLQLLHSFWSYLIVRTACRAISKGKVGKWNPLHVSKDDRSDIESSSDEDESPPPPLPSANQKHHSHATNGTNKSHSTNGYLTGALYPDEH